MNYIQLIQNPLSSSFNNEAASIPCVYLTSLCSFNVGSFGIKGNESILIHSGTGGVGLSALNILKWKGSKSHVFVTVVQRERTISFRYIWCINTLSGDYMDSNFKCLKTSGRIVDLSVTHSSHDEYTNNNHFRFNYGYHNFELTFSYSNLDIKEAIEYFNKRKHIGKIVLNNDIDILDQLFESQQNERNSNFSIFKIKL
ncbi:hypothetical protein ACTA71_002784 [Dictyostelium dimigraforme]